MIESEGRHVEMINAAVWLGDFVVFPVGTVVSMLCRGGPDRKINKVVDRYSNVALVECDDPWGYCGSAPGAACPVLRGDHPLVVDLPDDCLPFDEWERA